MSREVSRQVERSEQLGTVTTVPVTVIAAACNESGRAREWLEHLRWVRRIVVVDTGSRDGTQDLLRQGGAEVIDFRASELIHAAKNRALDEVGEGWVLDLDLDERVPRRLRIELQGRVQAAASAAAPVAWRIPFRHYIFGRWVQFGGWRTRHIRLYRAECVRYGEERAHSTPRVDGEVADLQTEILHFAHPTVHDFLVKMNRYTSHDAPRIVAHGRGGLRDRPPLPARPFRWLRASSSVFWNRYVKAAGFRDGIPGLLIAALMAAYAFVEQAKVWEHRERESAAPAGAARDE